MHIQERQAMHRCIRGLEELKESDYEGSHVEADKLLCKFLREVGYQDAADAFEKCSDRVGFMYT